MKRSDFGGELAITDFDADGRAGSQLPDRTDKGTFQRAYTGVTTLEGAFRVKGSKLQGEPLKEKLGSGKERREIGASRGQPERIAFQETLNTGVQPQGEGVQLGMVLF